MATRLLRPPALHREVVLSVELLVPVSAFLLGAAMMVL